MHEKRMVPDIRFDGFTDEWEQCKISDIAGQTIGGGTPTTSNSAFWNGNIPWIQSSDLADGKFFDVIPRRYITKDGLSKSAARLVPPNSIAIVTRVGVGKLAYFPFLYATSQDFLSLSQLKSDPYFTAYLCYRKLQSELNSVQGTSIKGLTKDGLLEKSIMIPRFSEQREIGTCLKGVDGFIDLYQRKYSRLCDFKKSMLDKMFPKDGADAPEIRFAGFSGTWEQRKLGDFVQFSKGTGYSKADLRDSGTPIILYGRLYTKYETVISDIDTFAEVKVGSVYSHGGEVIVPASGETAEDISIASVVEKPGVLLGGDLNIITPPANLDSAFLAISISNGKPHSDMARMAQGKSVVHLHNTDLEKIDLLYPGYEEQIQISTYFKTLDSLITLQQRKIELLKNIKKAFLEKMFV